MANGSFTLPPPRNGPVLSHAPGTPERAALLARLGEVRAPHRHAQVSARLHQAGPAEVRRAAEAALRARRERGALPPEDRAAVLLEAADLLAGPWRATLNAASILGQSKSVQLRYPHQG